VGYEKWHERGDRTLRLSSGIGLVVIIAALIVLWKIRSILLLLFAAVVFATAINRLVRLLQRLNMKRGWAIAISILGLIALLVGVGALVLPQFLSQVRQLANLIPPALDQLERWALSLQDWLPISLGENFRSLNGLVEQLQSFTPRIFNNFFSLFSNSLGILLQTLLVLVLIIMLLAQPQPYRRGFTLLFPSFYRRRVDQILQKCETALGGWVVGILFNMTVITIMSAIGLWILGIPLVFGNAILAGLLTFIPNVGPTMSVIPPAILGLLEAPWKAGAVVILYIIIQQLESNILTPLVMEKQVSLLPAVTLISQLIFASFFGFLGLFLALPIVVVAQVWLQELVIKDILNHWNAPGFKPLSAPVEATEPEEVAASGAGNPQSHCHE